MIRTGADLRLARESMDMGRGELAALLRLEARTEAELSKRVHDMERGARPISGPVAVAVEAMTTGWRPWRQPE